MADPAIGNFRKGAEEAKEASKYVQFARSQFFHLDDDGDSAIMRLLTDSDQWVVVEQYTMVPTKPKPKSYKGDNWPQAMPAVSRSDQAFEGIYTDDYIKEVIIPATAEKKGRNKVKNASARQWALGCLREEVKEDGKIVGFRDATREVQPMKDGKPDGDPVKEKAIVLINMGWKNFFGTLAGFAGHYGTVLDRDYKFVRVGSGTDTQYNILPLDPLPFEGGVYDLRRKIVADRYELEWEGDDDSGRPTGLKAGSVDLLREVSYRASDEYYKMWFIAGADDQKAADDGDDDSNSGDDGSATANDVSQDQLAALAERVTTYSKDSGGEEVQAAVAGGMKAM